MLLYRQSEPFLQLLSLIINFFNIPIKNLLAQTIVLHFSEYPVTVDTVMQFIIIYISGAVFIGKDEDKLTSNQTTSHYRTNSGIVIRQIIVSIH